MVNCSFEVFDLPVKSKAAVTKMNTISMRTPQDFRATFKSDALAKKIYANNV